MIGEEKSVCGPCGDTPLPVTTRHMTSCGTKLCNFRWSQQFSCLIKFPLTLKGCLVFKKFSLITHHSIFIIHRLSLKIPQLPKSGTFGTLFFIFYVGPIPEHHVISSVSLPASPSLFSFHFLPL